MNGLRHFAFRDGLLLPSLPAKAGIQDSMVRFGEVEPWTLAFAGVSGEQAGQLSGSNVTHGDVK